MDEYVSRIESGDVIISYIYSYSGETDIDYYVCDEHGNEKRVDREYLRDNSPIGVQYSNGESFWVFSVSAVEAMILENIFVMPESSVVPVVYKPVYEYLGDKRFFKSVMYTDNRRELRGMNIARLILEGHASANDGLYYINILSAYGGGSVCKQYYKVDKNILAKAMLIGG